MLRQTNRLSGQILFFIKLAKKVHRFKNEVLWDLKNKQKKKKTTVSEGSGLLDKCLDESVQDSQKASLELPLLPSGVVRVLSEEEELLLAELHFLRLSVHDLLKEAVTLLEATPHEFLVGLLHFTKCIQELMVPVAFSLSYIEK